jgi:acetyl esterase/lipase
MRALAGQGYATASPDYRLATRTRPAFPEAIGDVRCAIRWLRAHADEHELQADRIAAIGTSAGGHLAALLATAPQAGELDSDCDVANTSPKIHAAVTYYAPFDLRPARKLTVGAEAVVHAFLGAKRKEDPERAALASPVTHVDSDDPPMLLVHGTADPTVDVSQSRRMYRALRDAGVTTTYIEVPGADHAFPIITRRPMLQTATCTTLAFLQAALRP